MRFSGGMRGELAAVGTTTFDIPMVNVPAVYAGQTIDIYAYGPGYVGAGATSSNYSDATATDRLTIAVGFDGPPVHLLSGP
jgi:hypothetical protein